MLLSHLQNQGVKHQVNSSHEMLPYHVDKWIVVVLSGLHKVRNRTVQYSAVQYCAVQYNAIQYNTMQYSTVQYSTMQYSTVQYSTVLYIACCTSALTLASHHNYQQAGMVTIEVMHIDWARIP